MSLTDNFISGVIHTILLSREIAVYTNMHRYYVRREGERERERPSTLFHQQIFIH